ncbi:MAG: SCO6745 family protein [Ilumatobacteraceae bacterium]
MNNKELLDAVCPTINAVGSAFYFIPETMALGKELGLGGMEFYVQGRGGQMGNTDSAAVAAAFGYFSPALVKSVWDAACAKCDPRKAGAAHMQAAANLGRAKFTSLANLDAFVAAMDKVNNAANPEGLGLYAAIRSETLATDAPGRAMQLLAILREFRGSAHLVALRAAGIDGKKAHAAKRPDMWKQFGYSEDDMPTIDDAFLAQMAKAEEITDAIVEPAFAVLNDAERATLVAGVQAAKEALAN